MNATNELIQSATEEVEPQQSVGAVAEASRSQAEIQAALLIAKANPRDQQAAIDSITASCQRLSLAAKSEYRYSRGGNDISGANVHLLKVIACAWGNIQHGFRILSQTSTRTQCEAFAWDMQTNVKELRPFTVRHVRETKSGEYPLTGDRDIYELVANYGSRRVRSCLEGIIPKDVVDDALATCRATINAKVKVTPELLKRMLEGLEPLGITKRHIELKIQRNLEAITPIQVMQLKEIKESIENGMGVVDDYFPVIAEEKPTEELPTGDGVVDEPQTFDKDGLPL